MHRLAHSLVLPRGHPRSLADFECEDGYGIVVADAAKLSVAFDIGSTVAVDGYEGAVGTVRYHGPHKKKKDKIVFGVELDAPSGKNNGSTKDGKYFECADDHGVLVVNQEKLKTAVPSGGDAAVQDEAEEDAAGEEPAVEEGGDGEEGGENSEPEELEPEDTTPEDDPAGED